MENTNFTIIIPTFNRTKELLYNLSIIEKISQELCLDIPIIIGDDGSNEEHGNAINNYISQSSMSIVFYRNTTNLGIEENELKLVSMVKTDYAMLLGEDDYLNTELIAHINTYIEHGEVNAIIPNFYGINKELKQLRTPRFPVKDDMIISKGDVKYYCYATQMSGLTFKVQNVCDEYRRRKINGNSYPQIFFIAYNLEEGKGVHITKNPFRNTVLKKKQFDYSVDNLLPDLLKIINVLNIQPDQKKQVTKFVLNNEVTRYGNAYTWTHPNALFKKVNNYEDDIDNWTRNQVKKKFISSYFKAPFIVAHYFFVRRYHYKNKVL